MGDLGKQKSTDYHQPLPLSLNYYVLLSELGDKFLLSSCTLQAVAGSAQQLQVVNVVDASAGHSNDVVYSEVAEGEEMFATIAHALLLSEQCVLMRAVGW